MVEVNDPITQYKENVKLRAKKTGVPEHIIENVNLTRWDQYSKEKGLSATGYDDPVVYNDAKLRNRGFDVKWDDDQFAYTLRRDIHFARDGALPINLPEEYGDNIPFAYDGGYILLDDREHIQIVVAAEPLGKMNLFGDRHDYAAERLTKRTGKRPDEYRAAQRCYVVHTYNSLLDKVETLVVPIVSVKIGMEDDYHSMQEGDRAHRNWPEQWESVNVLRRTGELVDATRLVNSNQAKVDQETIGEAEDRYSMAIAREWMFNQQNYVLRFVTTDALEQWAVQTAAHTQIQGQLRNHLKEKLADPTVEPDEAIRSYLRQSLVTRSGDHRALWP